MSYSREEVKTITDKILNMARADGVEVRFSGGERSATRYANSTITANLQMNLSTTAAYCSILSASISLSLVSSPPR